MYGEEEGSYSWGVRLSFGANVNFEGIFPDKVNVVLEEVGVSLSGDFSMGIRMLGNVVGDVKKTTMAFEWDGEVSDFSFECTDDEDCEAEGPDLYCNDPRDGTDLAIEDLLTCRGKKDDGEWCTTDSSCLSGSCSYLKCG